MASKCMDEFVARSLNTDVGKMRECGCDGTAFAQSLHPDLPSVRFRLSMLCRLASLTPWVFRVACLLVAAVSVHDAALVVVNHDIIGEVERNPIGAWLLEVQGGEVWLFVLLKLAGTALVCAVLVTIYRISQQIGMIVVAALAAFQVTLLGYLTLA